MVLVKKWPFFKRLFLANIAQENISSNILERKDAFLGYNNKQSKKWKNWHFSNGVNPWIWSKNGHFPTFFLGNIGHENVFYDILERKNALLGYKNKKVKDRKIAIFPKGLIHGFGRKMAIFPTFIFGQYRRGKCLLRYSRAKRSLSRL